MSNSMVVKSPHNNKKSGNENQNVTQKKKAGSEKGDKFCTHCNVVGHMKENCFKIHGYPEWYKKMKEQKGKQFINMAERSGEQNVDQIGGRVVSKQVATLIQ